MQAKWKHILELPGGLLPWHLSGQFFKRSAQEAEVCSRGSYDKIKAVAVNAWQWVEEGKAKIIQQHAISYSGFKRGTFKAQEAELKLMKAVGKMMK